MTDQNQKPNQKSILESLGARGQDVPDQTQDEILTQAMCEASLEARIQNGILQENLTELPTPKPEIQPPQIPTTLKTTSSPETTTETTPASNIDLQPVTPNSIPVSQELPPKELTKDEYTELLDNAAEGVTPPARTKDEIKAECKRIKYEAANKIGFVREETKNDAAVAQQVTIKNGLWQCPDCGAVVSDKTYHLCTMKPIMEKTDDSNLRRLKEYIAGSEYEINRVMYQLSSLCSIPQVIPSMTLWDMQKGVDFPKLVFELVKTPGFVDNVWPYLKLLLGASKDNTVWAASVLTTIATFEAVKVLPFATGQE